MKRKIQKYLSAKDKGQYDQLDKLFDMYLSGEMKQTLSKYYDVEIFPSLNRKDRSMQVYYKFQNICVWIEFSEDKYQTIVYSAYSLDKENLSDVDKRIISHSYKEDFEFASLVKELDEQIQNHPELKDTTTQRKRKKIYAWIARLSFCAPLVVIAIISLYVMITGDSIQGNAWWLVSLVVFLIIWFVFDVKSKR